MYCDIIKTHQFKHIIKLHTKTDVSYESLTNYLLSCSLDDLLTKSSIMSNCIGNNYLSIKEDFFQ